MCNSMSTKLNQECDGEEVERKVKEENSSRDKQRTAIIFAVEHDLLVSTGSP